MRHGLVVGLDAGVLDVLAVTLVVQHHRLRRARLDLGRMGRVGRADAHAEHGEHLGRQFEQGGDLFRVVAHAADVHHAQAERLGSGGGVLRGQGGVDDGGEEHLGVIQPGRGALELRGDATQAGKVGQPHELQRCIAHMRLVAGELGEAGAFALVAHGDYAPDVEVGGAGGGLRGGDDGGELGVTDRIGQVRSHRAVRQQLLDQRGEIRFGWCGVGAVAGDEGGRCRRHGHSSWQVGA